MPEPARLSYSTSEFGALIGVSPVQVQRWCLHGVLQSIKVGNRWEVLITETDRLTGGMILPALVPDPALIKRRPPMSLRLRFRILERDGFRCVYCGATAKDQRLAVDHVVSVADGGTDDEDNLVTACDPCNRGKSSRSLRVVR